MKKIKHLFRICLLLLVTLSSNSCRNDEIQKNGEKNIGRDNAKFFIHDKKTLSTGKLADKDYVEILENYNETTDFIKTIPDQKGMPIWVKMEVFDAENATGLIIPLSHDHETLSSILFATLDSNNNVIGVKDVTNAMMQNIVYDNKFSTESKQSLFYTFMYTDNHTFGNEYFTNIPEDLFVGLKYGENNSRVRIKNFATSHVTSSENNKMLYIETCGTYWQCKNHETWANCDHCNACFVTSCSSIMIWIDDYEPFPGGGSGGGGGGGSGGGGGGGGGGTPSPPTPTDPCTLSTDVFYRLAPNCNGDEPSTDPCFKIIEENAKLKESYNKSLFQSRLTEVSQNIATSWEEKSFSFGVSSTNTSQEAVTPIKVGVSSSASVGIYALYPNMLIYGALHTHPKKEAEYTSFSFTDLYSFSQGNHANPKLKYFLVKAYDGTVYAITITNQLDFNMFFNSHSASDYVTAENTYNIGTDIGGDIENAAAYLRKHFGKTKDEAYEAGLAMVMKKYNMGMSISKKDSNGDFKPIFVNELTPDPQKPKKKTYEQSNDCNL